MLKRLRTAHPILYCILAEVLFLGSLFLSSLVLTVADNGTGYPPAVLAALQGMPQNEQTPHILGLHVVEQIAAAHGGRVTFGQNVPNGAKATVWLPLDQKAPVAFGQNVVK